MNKPDRYIFFQEKNGIQKSRQQPRSSGDQNPSSRAKPPQTSTLPETGDNPLKILHSQKQVITPSNFYTPKNRW